MLLAVKEGQAKLCPTARALAAVSPEGPGERDDGGAAADVSISWQ
jgi:hypothetical protein